MEMAKYKYHSHLFFSWLITINMGNIANIKRGRLPSVSEKSEGNIVRTANKA